MISILPNFGHGFVFNITMKKVHVFQLAQMKLMKVDALHHEIIVPSAPKGPFDRHLIVFEDVYVFSRQTTLTSSTKSKSSHVTSIPNPFFHVINAVKAK